MFQQIMFLTVLKKPLYRKDLVNPINVYGKSKVEGEKLISQILKKFIILRTSWIFSDVIIL